MPGNGGPWGGGGSWEWRPLGMATGHPSSSSSFLLRQAFADVEALTRSLQVDLSLALSVASRISLPCAYPSMFSSVFLSLPTSTCQVLGYVASIFHSRYNARTISLLFLILLTIVSFCSTFSRNPYNFIAYSFSSRTAWYITSVFYSFFFLSILYLISTFSSVL